MQRVLFLCVTLSQLCINNVHLPLSFSFNLCSLSVSFFLSLMAAVATLVPFGHVQLSIRQLFFQSAHSLGVINYKPIVPGHVMVITRRSVAVRPFSLSLVFVSPVYTVLYACACVRLLKAVK